MHPLELARIGRWDSPAYVVAEAGVNHNGDLTVALDLVRAAAASGIDAVKFQTYKADRIATKASSAYWDRTKEPAGSQYDLFKRYDAFGPDEYRRIAEECASAGVTFLTTPFDVDSVDWLDELLPAYKIASADMTDLSLVQRIGATGKPVLLSTGAADLDEVRRAVGWLEDAGSGPVAVLQCVLSYPTTTSDASVGALVALRAAFPHAVLGYSDHTMPVDSYAAISAAYALGARVIEKHYTLDKAQAGNDHWHAFDPDDFSRLRRDLDQLHDLLGQPTKTVLDSEQPARTHARRSLVSRGRIEEGSAVTREMLDQKRPGTGIEPWRIDELVGLRARRTIEDDEMLDWEMFDGGVSRGRAQSSS
jgi:sialic acid synthase SpsE